MNPLRPSPTVNEMRRVAHYMMETLGLFAAGGALLAHAQRLEAAQIDEQRRLKGGKDAPAVYQR